VASGAARDSGLNEPREIRAAHSTRCSVGPHVSHRGHMGVTWGRETVRGNMTVTVT
jgi:hypothetical protein